MVHTTKQSNGYRTPPRKPAVRVPMTKTEKWYARAKVHYLVNGIARSPLDQLNINRYKEMIHKRRKINDEKRESGDIFKANGTSLQKEYEFFLSLWRWKHYNDTDTTVFEGDMKEFSQDAKDSGAYEHLFGRKVWFGKVQAVKPYAKFFDKEGKEITGLDKHTGFIEVQIIPGNLIRDMHRFVDNEFLKGEYEYLEEQDYVLTEWKTDEYGSFKELDDNEDDMGYYIDSIVLPHDKVSVQFKMNNLNTGKPIEHEFRNGIVKKVNKNNNTREQHRFLIHFENGNEEWMGLSPELQGKTWEFA